MPGFTRSAKREAQEDHSDCDQLARNLFEVVCSRMQQIQLALV